MKLAQAISAAETAEQGLLELLCTAAEQAWAERLREGLAPEDCGAAFQCAAAFTAAANLVGGRGGGAVSSFTAGVVSIQEAEAGQQGALAERMQQTAVRMMAPYVIADDFCFRGVRG